MGEVAQQVSLWVAQGTVTGLSAMAARGAVKRVVAKFRESTRAPVWTCQTTERRPKRLRRVRPAGEFVVEAGGDPAG